MKLTWFGHAAFLVETEGTRIIIDPFRSPDSGGYAPIDELADLVIVSHENDTYHSHLGQIRPPFEVVRALELGPAGTTVRDVSINAVRVFETPEKKPGDEVTIVQIRAEGLRLVHLGDLGHDLTKAELATLRHPDVLMIPAGGPPTLDLSLVPGLLDRLDPAVVIPMHYLVPGKINLKIKPVEELLRVIDANQCREDDNSGGSLVIDHQYDVERIGGSTLEISREAKAAKTRVVVLEPGR